MKREVRERRGHGTYSCKQKLSFLVQAGQLARAGLFYGEAMLPPDVILSPAAELLFYRLRAQADDYGCLDGSIQAVRATSYPRGTCTDEEIYAWLSELVNAGLMGGYCHEAKTYLYFLNWQEVQHRRPPVRVCPDPATGTPWEIVDGISESFRAQHYATQSPLAFCRAVVDYLNHVCGTKYTTRSKRHNAFIHARQREGFTLEEFKQVIDVKASQWLHDPEMQIYLRPETLFCGKFQSYLNEARLPSSRGTSKTTKTWQAGQRAIWDILEGDDHDEDGKS